MISFEKDPYQINKLLFVIVLLVFSFKSDQQRKFIIDFLSIYVIKVLQNTF